MIQVDNKTLQENLNRFDATKPATKQNLNTILKDLTAFLGLILIWCFLFFIMIIF